jgi:type I restriction enzyme, S subunit
VQLGRQRSPSKIGKANPTPYIRAANITEGGVDLSDVLEMEFSETEKETFALKVGDVLLTEASGSPAHVGRPAIWMHADGLYCFQNTVLRFSPGGISSEYAFYSFLAMQKLGVFRKLSGGVGINHLSAGKFSKLPMPLPPIAEQLALIEQITECFSRCADQIAFNAHSLKQSTAQRQNILRAAFAGQLVPQDPNDEPASVLLERIRAERAQCDADKKPSGRKVKETT